MWSLQWQEGARVGVHWLISGASQENQQLPGGYSKNRGAKTIGKRSCIIGDSGPPSRSGVT
jgi:hypothetical protein